MLIIKNGCFVEMPIFCFLAKILKKPVDNLSKNHYDIYK